jgi:enamine deaminase RidA (YjgF/YER057c/UK114 family)
MELERVFSGSPWEKKVSYCRAIRYRDYVSVSGTTSMKDGAVFAPGNPEQQTLRCLEIIENALKEFGLDRRNVVRTRMFVSDISKWEAFGKAHGEFFRDCPPTTGMYEIKSLIDPDLMIEIEADAYAF